MIDARRILDADCPHDRDELCWFCRRYTLHEDHAPDCPWLSMPRIVAALEAAELVTVAYEEERILFGRPPGSQLAAALEKLDEALDA